MFGTFIEERKEEPIVFGITKNISTNNPIKVIFHEWGEILNERIKK
jgi:hypothetical protein